MQIKTLCKCVALVAGLNAGAAQADFFVGGQIGQSTVKDWIPTGAPGVQGDDKDIAFKVYGGYALNDYVSFRLGYANLGAATVKANLGFSIEAEAETQAIFLDVVGSYRPVENLALSIKLGAAHAESELSVTQSSGGLSDSESIKDKQVVAVPGIGVSYFVTDALAIGLEYERYLDGFKVKDGAELESDIDVVSLGLEFRF